MDEIQISLHQTADLSSVKSAAVSFGEDSFYWFSNKLGEVSRVKCLCPAPQQYVYMIKLTIVVLNISK